MKSLDSTTPKPKIANIGGFWLVLYWGLPLLPIPVALLIVGPTFEPILGGLFFSALIMAMASGTPRQFVLEPDALVVYWRFRLKRYDYARMKIEDRDFTWHYFLVEWSLGSSKLVLVHPELWPSLTLQVEGADQFDKALLKELHSRVPLPRG